MITALQLAEIMQRSLADSTEWLPSINNVMDKYSINTNLRCAHFLAQIGHESMRLHYTKELASGKAYEGRKDLGNTYLGDGIKYKGRGLIMVTGRYNYEILRKELNVDCIDHPELLETQHNAALVAGWFWNKNRLNNLADLDLLTQITRKINGGINGLEDRRLILSRAKKALGI